MQMNRNVRIYITCALLLAAMGVAFGLPKPKYQSPDILGKLDIPYTMPGWRSVDYSGKLSERPDERFNFISEVFARLYGNQAGRSLLFLVLDAGNFHHPKVCFRSSGYEIRENVEQKLDLLDGRLDAKYLVTERGGESFLIVYWICINKKQVDWTEQKFQQLWYSLFNKKKVGLMGRLDIPLGEAGLESGIELAEEFIGAVYARLPQEQREWVFGG